MSNEESSDEFGEGPPRVLDKRKQHDGVPVEQPAKTPEPLPEELSEEERARRAEWDAMSDQDRQEMIARQAAEMAANPYQGGGMQAPDTPDAGKKRVLTMFTIVVHEDGTAVASDDLDLSKFEAAFPVDANKIYRAVCEIKKDIESTDAARATVQLMVSQAAVAQQLQGEALRQRTQPQPGGRRRR